MKTMKFLVSALGLTLSLISGVALCDNAVIVHPSNNSTMDKDAVSKIFLGKSKSFPNGNDSTPVNQKEGSDIRTTFDKKILEKSPSQVKAYWSKLIFTGKGTPPKNIDSGDEVKNLVAQNPGVIGYIDSSKVDDSVKVLFTF